MQIEELGVLGLVAHGDSPISKVKAEKHFAHGGKYSPRGLELEWVCLELGEELPPGGPG
jgi:hypothetical protein